MTLAERTTDAFLEVVCGDDDWLRAEFDAIVAANWDPPDPVPPGPARGPAGPRPRARSSWRSCRPTGRPPGANPPAHQRSPPRAATAARPIRAALV
jgi:hypothetical protein